MYSSLLIALGAASLVQLNYFLVSGQDGLDTYTAFLFFSTIFLYNTHRVVGMEKVKEFEHEGRFAVIKLYRNHIILYGILGFLLALYFFFKMKLNLQILLFAPVLLSLLYVIPTLGWKIRLRDLDYLKIFLIAIVWAWTTSFIPEYILHGGWRNEQIFSFLERMFFFLAITIPFDIRDLKVDASSAVKTIPGRFGAKRSIWIALFCLLIHFGIVILLNHNGYYHGNLLLPYLLISLITGLLIWFSDRGWEDYYFSGLLDGTMIIAWVLVTALA